MRLEEIFGLPSMPAAAPSHPRGPNRFIDRQHMAIVYESDHTLPWGRVLHDCLSEDAGAG